MTRGQELTVARLRNLAAMVQDCVYCGKILPINHPLEATLYVPTPEAWVADGWPAIDQMGFTLWGEDSL